VQLVVGYDNIRSMDQLTSWLFRVARNKVTDSYRKKKPASFTDIGFRNSDDEDAPMLADLLPSIDQLPEQELMSEMIWSKIDETLAGLPDNQRQVFIWHEFEQKSFKEMQEMTGETVNTLLSRKRYAVMALRASLEELYKELIND
jgi:RNA polymerase sigma factor (sigma-70 family)